MSSTTELDKTVVKNNNNDAVLDVLSDDTFALSHVMFDERYGPETSMLIKSYSPVQISFGINDQFDFFKSKRVMLPPISWPTLCGNSIPSSTKQQISSYNPLQIDSPIGLIVSTFPPSDSANSGEKCSIQDIMKNVDKLNQEVHSSSNLISFLVLSDNFLHSTSSLPNNSIRNVTSGCCDVNTIALSVVFVPTSATEDIMASINASKNVYGIDPWLFGKDSAKWPYYMATTVDVNRDGIINKEDYILFKNSSAQTGNDTVSGPIQAPSVDSDTTNNDHVTYSSKDQYKYVYGIYLLVVVIVMCLANHVVLRHRLNSIRRRHQLDEEHRSRNVTNETNFSDRDALTEEEFNVLPQVEYRLLKGHCIGSTGNDTARMNTNSTSIKEEEGQQHEQGELEGHSSAKAENACRCFDNKMTEGPEKSYEIDLEAITTSLRSSFDNWKGDKIAVEINECAAKDDIREDTKADQAITKVISTDSSAIGVSGIECCSICLEDFFEHEIVIPLPKCSHIFHTECIKQWVLRRKPNANSCPLCKSIILDKRQEGQLSPSSTTTPVNAPNTTHIVPADPAEMSTQMLELDTVMYSYTDESNITISVTFPSEPE